MLAEIAALELRQLSWPRARKAVAAVVSEFTRYDLLTYSSAIAFQALYAVLPLTLFTLAGLGVVGAGSVYHDDIAPTLRRDLSGDAFAIANRTAMRVIGNERYFWCTIGLFVTLWAMAASLRAMMTPLNRIYGAKETRSWTRRLLVSIGAGALVIVCLLGALLVVAAGRLVHPGGVLTVLADVLRWLLALLLLVGANAVMLWFVPAKRRPLRWISLGSTLSIVCWVVATVGFGAYISAVSYSSYYGSLGAVVLLLAYLHVAAIAFLLGVVVDALLRERVSRDTGRRGRGRTRAGR